MHRSVSRVLVPGRAWCRPWDHVRRTELNPSPPLDLPRSHTPTQRACDVLRRRQPPWNAAAAAADTAREPVNKPHAPPSLRGWDQGSQSVGPIGLVLSKASKSPSVRYSLRAVESAAATAFTPLLPKLGLRFRATDLRARRVVKSGGTFHVHERGEGRAVLLTSITFACKVMSMHPGRYECDLHARTCFNNRRRDSHSTG